MFIPPLRVNLITHVPMQEYQRIRKCSPPPKGVQKCSPPLRGGEHFLMTIEDLLVINPIILCDPNIESTCRAYYQHLTKMIIKRQNLSSINSV